MEINWHNGTVLYQIYPRSFQDTNNDGIGDLPGIINRLDYLTELGINAIWLSPIYKSPQHDFGYDIADYLEIDSIFGTMEDFDTLLEESHKRGIRVMMDYVPNHTSTEHSWFRESRSSKESSKRDWYIWHDPLPDGSPPNNWLSVFGGSAWEWDEKTQRYYLHTFAKEQPDLNWRNPEVVEGMLTILRFWLDKGVDGFRVDVPYHLFKDPAYRSEPENPNYIPTELDPYQKLLHIYTSWLPESFEMVKKFTDVLKEYNGRFMITEAWGTLEDLLNLYTTVNWRWYAPFNFSLITTPWNTDLQQEAISTFTKGLKGDFIPCFVLGNHDKSRVATRIGQKQARVAALLELTLNGLPVIYYGEELGMEDTPIPKDLLKDTYEKFFPGQQLGRDPQRTPMQWTKNPKRGFSTNSPWLPINENTKKISVETEEQDPASTLQLYKLLIKLKKHHPALRLGSYIPLPSDGKNVLGFIREKDEERLLVLCNFDSEKKRLQLPYKGSVLCSATLTIPEGEHLDLSSYTLNGDEGLILHIS